jgi:hypothetical protein
MRGLMDFGDLRHQNRGGLQVPIGVRDMRVAEVCAEREKMTRDRVGIATALFE